MAFCMDIHVSIPLFLIPEFYSGDLSVAFLEDGGGRASVFPGLRADLWPLPLIYSAHLQLSPSPGCLTLELGYCGREVDRLSPC